MAARVRKIILGVDVGKQTLDVWCRDGTGHQQIANERRAIARFLKGLSGPAQLAIEPTSSYHLEPAEQAHRLGHEVFLVNPRQLAHYRQAVGQRNKSDVSDAALLARYLEREGSELRRFKPLCRDQQHLWGLVKRRALVVNMGQQLRQSLRPVKLSAQGTERSLKALIGQIDRRIAALLCKLGWSEHAGRLRTIPGVGPVNAAALVAAYHRGEFRNADRFIAFLGMDVRIRQSGQYTGKCKLTKCGEPTLRRSLWCATQPARSYPPFDDYLKTQLAKGLSKTAAKVILARKLARIAFALLRNGTTFHQQEASQAP